jgi:hypothetical protein
LPHDWKAAEQSWMEFLHRIESCRAGLYCSVSNAWFRGHEDSTWALHPSLFRIPDRQDADSSKRSKRLDAEIAQCESNVKNKTKHLRALKHSVALAHKSADKLAIRYAQTDYQELDDHLRAAKKQLDVLRREKEVTGAVHYGERDAFVEFSFRAANRHRSSWETLAEMQHYHVPTRLLDWSEVLAIAVYFALLGYIKALDQIWNPKAADGSDLMGDDKGQLPFVIPSGLPTPCVWVLNPFRLSRSARGENALWDPTTDARCDYFESFFVKRDWPYERPVPIYSPWHNPRIAAQQAMFTFHGIDKRPLDVQLGSDNDILRRVDLEPAAAVYAVKHLSTFLGLNSFLIFRDLDSLGSDIKRHFLVPNQRRK